MSALLQAELLKLRTTRTFAVVVGVALALSLLIVVLSVLLSDEIEIDADAADLFSVDFVSLFILLLGVMGMTGEWRHRTITSSVLAAPDRVRLLAAKVLAYATAGAALSLIVSLIAGLVGIVLVSTRGSVDFAIADVLDVMWRNLAVAALMGALGVCVGGIARNQVAGLIGVLVLAMMVEPIVFGLAPEVGRFGPTTAPSGIQAFDLVENPDLLSPGAGALVALGWIVLAFTLASALLRQRDLV